MSKSWQHPEVPKFGESKSACWPSTRPPASAPRSLLATMAAAARSRRATMVLGGLAGWVSALGVVPTLALAIFAHSRSERVSALPWRRGWRHRITGARWRHFAVFIESALCDVSGRMSAGCRGNRPGRSLQTCPVCRRTAPGINCILGKRAAARPRRKNTSWRYDEGHTRSLNFNRFSHFLLAPNYLYFIHMELFN